MAACGRELCGAMRSDEISCAAPALGARHKSPKQLVKLHSLAPLLEGIQGGDPGVLVREVASRLYEAFKAHDVL